MENIFPPYQNRMPEGLGLTMKGKIRTKEKCPKCKKPFMETLQGIVCPDCLTVPKRYFIDLYEKKRLKIYTDPNGNSLDSYLRAQRVLEHIRYEIDNHKFDPTKYVKHDLEQFYFSTQIEKWFTRKKKYAEVKESLADSYVRALSSYKGNYFLPHFGNMDIREIRTRHIKDFYEALPPHLSAKMQWNVVTALQNFFNELEEDEIIENKPSFKKILKLIDVKEHEIPWFEHIEQEEILDYIETISRHRPIIGFMCETGLRPGEGMALFRDDYDSKHQLLHIRKTFSDRKLKHTTKGGRVTDEIPVTDEAAEIIESLPLRVSTFIFINPNTGRPYRLDVLDKLWAKVRVHFNIPKNVKLYNFTKHSFATQLARAGGTAYEIKDLLRHADIRTSLKYVGKDMTAMRTRLKERAKLIELERRRKKSG